MTDYKVKMLKDPETGRKHKCTMITIDNYYIEQHYNRMCEAWSTYIAKDKQLIMHSMMTNRLKSAEDAKFILDNIEPIRKLNEEMKNENLHRH